MDIREQLVSELDTARARLFDLVGNLPPSAEVYPGWTVKELLAHITGWDDLVIDVLQRHVSGQEIPLSVMRGIDYYNSQTVTQRQNLPFEVILNEYHTTRQQLKELIFSIPAETYEEQLVTPWGSKGQVKGFIRVFSHHETEHEEELHKSIKH